MAIYGVEHTLTYVAWDTAANAGKTGDVGNHTLRWIKDGTASAPTNSPSEVDATNAPGVYKIAITATECQAVFGVLAGQSSTSDVSIMPISLAFERTPNAAPGANGGLPTVDANGRTDANVEAWIGTALSESSSGRQAGNIDTFFDNADAATAQTVDDVGGGGGSSDWTSDEKEEIRHRLGIDGTTSTPATNSPNLSVDLNDDAITSAKFDESTAFPLASADSGATEVARTGADSDTLETLSDQIDGVSNKALLLSTTIATVTSQTELILTAGSADDDAYNEAYAYAVITDQSTSTQKAIVYATDWDGGTLTLSLKDAPGFTVAAGDSVDIISRPPQDATITTATAASTASSATLFTGDFFEIVQGSSKSFTINVDPSIVDATGKTPKASFRKVSTSSETAFTSGTAQTGSATTIQLDASLAYSDDELNGYIIELTGGTGSGQKRVITDYIGASDTATVGQEWTTTPDNTSTYSIYAPGIVSGTVNNGGSSSQSFTFELSKDETVGMALSGGGSELSTVNPNVLNAYNVTITVPDAPSAGDCTPAGILYAKVLQGQGGVSGAQCS